MQQVTPVLAERQHRGKPGVREFQREAGQHQHNEAGEQRSVLQPEAHRHAHHETVLQFAPRNHFRPPDDEVMQQHAADDREDHAQIEAADPAHRLAAHVGRKRRIHVDLCGREFFRDAGMTLAASPDQIGVVDGRPWIARRENAVRPVATGAIRHDLRASLRGQSVVAGQVSGLAAARHSKFLRKAHAFVAAATGHRAHVLGRDRGIRIGVRFNGVNAVAIGAHRRLPVAFGDGLSVDALFEFLGDRVVTLAAGRRHIELEDGRLGILGVENLVRSVAVGADRGLLGSGRDRMPVDALRVRGNHLRALSTILHHEFLAVAGAAGGRDIRMVYARFRIARRQQFMRAAMAIDAGSGLVVAALNCLAVETAVVRSLLVGVARRASDFQGRRFVRGTLYVGVAVHAGKHAAVDGIFEALRIDVQADRFAVHVVGQRGIAVAGEALFRS